MAGKGDPVSVVHYELKPETDRETFVAMFEDVAAWLLEEGWTKALHLMGREEDPRQLDAVAFWRTDIDWRRAYEEPRLRKWVADCDRMCNSVHRAASSYLASAAGLLVAA